MAIRCVCVWMYARNTLVVLLLGCSPMGLGECIYILYIYSIPAPAQWTTSGTMTPQPEKCGSRSTTTELNSVGWIGPPSLDNSRIRLANREITITSLYESIRLFMISFDFKFNLVMCFMRLSESSCMSVSPVILSFVKMFLSFLPKVCCGIKSKLVGSRSPFCCWFFFSF